MTDKTATIIALFVSHGWTVTIEPLAEREPPFYYRRVVFSRQNDANEWNDATSLCGDGDSIDGAVAAAHDKAVSFINLWHESRNTIP